MLRAAAESGITTIAATPHLRADFPHVRVGELAERCQELRDAIARAGVEIRLVSGAEASLVWALEASDEELMLASYDQRGTDLLIETPSLSVAGLDTLLYALRARGLRITLAHPERSPEFQRDPTPLEELTRQGVLLQLDAETLLRDARKSSSARLGQRLCRRGLAHALASDGHRAASWRPVTRLAEGGQAATALLGAKRAEWMTHSVPAAIVEGTELPEPPPVLASRTVRRLLRRR
jgi:protein-tyrosine phosphatase